MCAPSWRRNCLGGEAAPEKRKDGTSQQRTPTCSQPQRQAKQALSPIKNRAWWEKAAKWHLISPEDSVWTCLMPLFFWFMNECYPVGIYKKVLSLNCPSTGLCWFYTFSFDYYLIFLVSWTLIDRAYWRKLNRGKAASYSASLPLDQHTCHMDNTDTMVNSLALGEAIGGRCTQKPKTSKQK